MNFIFNPNCAEIFSHLIHAGGGGSYMTPPPLSPVIAVIKGQTKKQMIKFSKKKTFNSFLTVVDKKITLPNLFLYYLKSHCG